MPWTEERVELLKKLWAEGLSAGQIANRLGDVTRNAVIGKAHRMRLSSPARLTPQQKEARRLAREARSLSLSKTPPAISKAEAERQAAVRRAELLKKMEAARRPVAAAQPVEEVPPHTGVALLDLKESMCRFPLGHPGDEGFHFCGHQKAEGSPYCPNHTKIAFQPRQRRPKLPKAQNVGSSASYDKYLLIAAE
jgi:GcrA cell cycle regulator